jgi:hypothetical protein
MIHHFRLIPNNSYDTHISPSLCNPPYLFPPGPILIQTISAPVRLFSITDMTIGSHGTFIWIDTHIEDFYEQSTQGQRLAGRILDPVDNHDETDGYDDTARTTAATSDYDKHEVDTWTRVAIEEEQARIAIGSTEGEVVVLEYA